MKLEMKYCCTIYLIMKVARWLIVAAWKPKKSEVKAIAEGDVELIAIPHSKLEEWLCKYASWKSYIMRSFNERFLELLKSIESIAFHKLDERLIAYLKEKQRHTGSSVLKVSHYLIADELQYISGSYI
jgi:CRP/FNR family transcriptional regulator